MDVELVAKFSTSAPLKPDMALRLRDLGRFNTAPGACSYQIKSRGTAASLADAKEGLCAEITRRCEPVEVRFLSVLGKNEKNEKNEKNDEALVTVTVKEARVQQVSQVICVHLGKLGFSALTQKEVREMATDIVEVLCGTDELIDNATVVRQ